MKSTLFSFTIFRSWFELYATFSTFMMLLRTAINDVLPLQLRSFIESKLKAFFSKHQANNQVSLKINRFWDEHSGQRNELFYAALEYLPSRITRTYKSLKVGKLEKPKNLVFAVDGTQKVVDEFEGTKFTWKLDDGSNKDNRSRNLSFILTFNEKHRESVKDRYIPHVLRSYDALRTKQRVVKIYSFKNFWNERELSHPATFDTLALDPELKQAIIHDLDLFLKRKELYKKMGKTWKRGYLLYGPPGTGKSSIVAAMAKYLKFDVYDLQLTSIHSNYHLMKATRDTSNRSIIVIEDIDCNKEVHARRPPLDYYNSGVRQFGVSADFYDNDDVVHEDAKHDRFTLSGLLNYMDGLWSSSGEERIIVFTTNHKDKIDPALLRPGRMDMHINLSFLKAKAFRILASNYMDTEDPHPLFEQIEQLLEKIDVTPAEVAEQLIRHEDPNVALEELIKFLKEMDIQRQGEKETNDC